MTEKKERRRHRLATGIFHPEETYWSIQCYPNADGTPGEIDDRIHAQTEALAWEQFLHQSTLGREDYEKEGFKAVRR